MEFNEGKRDYKIDKMFYKEMEDKSNREEFEMSTMSANETHAEETKTTHKPKTTLKPTPAEANEQRWKNRLIKVTIVVYLLIVLIILYEFIKG